MKYNKEYKRSSFEPSIVSNNATSGGSSHYSKELYKKKESSKKPYSVLQRVEPRNRKRVENFNDDCDFLIDECLRYGMDDEKCMMAEEEGCWDAPQLQAIGPGVGNNLLIAEDIRPNTAQLQAIGPGGGNNLLIAEDIRPNTAQLEEMPTTSRNILACPIPSHGGFIQEYASPGGEYSFFGIRGRTPGVLAGYDSSAGKQRVFPKQSMFEESNLISVGNFNQKATTGISQEQYVKQNPVIDLKTTVGGKKFNIKLAQLYRPKLGEWDVLGFKLLTGRYPGKPQEFGYIQWFKDDFNCGISDVYQFRLGNNDISQEYLNKLPKDSCPPCPDIPLANTSANTSEDDNWWTDYNQLMWKDDEHYNSWKKKLDSRDGIRGDLKDLPGPGKNTWDWNLIDSGHRTNHPFYNRKYPDEDPNSEFHNFKAGNINILYHSKQAYQELTYEILNGKLKNATKKKIRRQWLIKLMGFISKAFLDVFQTAARRLESILDKLMIETNGQLNEEELNHIVADFVRVIDNHIVVMVDNLTLLDYVWDSAQLDGAHDHDPDSFYSILKDEIKVWTRDTIAEYRNQSASYRVKNQGGGNFTLVRNEDDEMDDYDTEEDDVPEGVALAAQGMGSATNLPPVGGGDIVACSDALKACQDGVQPACVYYTDNCVGVGTAVLEGAGRADKPEAAGTNLQPVRAFPTKQNTEIFKRISKLLITAIIKDEPIPSEIIEIFNSARVRTGFISPGTAEDAATLLSHHNEKMKEEFGENAPQLDISTSPMSKYFTVMSMVANHPNFEQQMTGIKMIMSYLSLHMKGESEWIIETFRELLDSRYKNTKPIIFAVQMIKKLGDVVKASEGVSNTNVADTVAAAGERIEELKARIITGRARVTELETQLAARPTQSKLVSVETELETARGNITALEGALETARANIKTLEDQLTTGDEQAMGALAELASHSSETVSLKMKQIEDLGEEIISLKAQLEEEKTKTNVPADVEELIKEEKEECIKEVNIYKEKIIEEVKKVNKQWEKDIESKDKTIKYIAIGAGVVIVLLILFLLMK